MTEWIRTDKILETPSNYYGRSIILAPNYSLVSTDVDSKIQLQDTNGSLIQISDDPRFRGYKICEYICTDNVINVLIEAASKEAAKFLKIRFLVEGMNLPEFQHQEDRELKFYLVKVKLPDGSFYSFSQTVGA